MDKIIGRVDVLERHPRIGKKVLEFGNDLIRELIEGNYRIIYRIESYEVLKKFYPPDIGLSPRDTTFGTAYQTSLNMNIITVEPFSVVGISVRTTNQAGRATHDIAALWHRFLSEHTTAQISNRTDETIYSVYTDYEDDHTQPYTVVLGCRVSDASPVPDGLTARRIAGGRYRSFVARGDLSQGAVYQAWTDIWNTDMNRAYTTDFEVYSEKVRNPERAEVDIHVAVTPD